MRLTMLMASAFAAAMLSATAAPAFEVQTGTSPGSVASGTNFDLAPDLDSTSIVLERFADDDDPNKPGKLQVFGNDVSTYGIPNYIPGPARETPYWVYTSPYFRSLR